MSDHRYTGKCRCGRGVSLVTSGHPRGLNINCPSCGRSIYIKRIEGEFNPDHKCDSRCTGAKGNVCSCSCGGANHGSDWRVGNVVAVVQGHSHSANRIETKFLGEVGKHITGEVTLRTRQAIANGRFYFRFTTNSNRDRIDWFVPDQYAPDWQAGWTGKIRAKVTKHVDHPQYGKSTTVIYVEEVV